jgi:hypothetical protein
VTWFRHRGDTKFCVGAPEAGSFVTLCNGRWPLADAAYGQVERHANPATEDRCGLCAKRSLEIATERAEVNAFVDYLMRGDARAIDTTTLGRIAREVRRLRVDLEERTNELLVAQRELADAQDPLGTKYGAALVEAIGIARALGNRCPGLMSTREQDRLRELVKVVPQ